MFESIRKILNLFTPAQRILALLILVSTLAIIQLGPTLIEENTKSCPDLEVQIQSQSRQIQTLTLQVESLTDQIIQDQVQCDKNLMDKGEQIQTLIDQVIEAAQASLNQTLPVNPDEVPSDPDTRVLKVTTRPEAEPRQDQTLKKQIEALTQLKRKVNNTIVTKHQ